MMRRKLLLVLVCVALLCPTAMAQSESPIFLSHTVTDYTEGTDSVTVGVLLHLDNPGDTPLHGVRLSNVPLLIITVEEVFLDIGDIEAGGNLDVSFSLVTPMLLSQEEFAEQPLFWACEWTDETGSLVEFPALSRSPRGDL